MSKNKEYYKGIGLTLPKDVENHYSVPYREAEIDKVRKKYPDHELISYSTVGARVWAFICRKEKLKIYNPPIIIDRRKDPPRFSDGESTAMMFGINNSMWALLDNIHLEYKDGTTIDLPCDITATNYECRIFHRNVLDAINLIWHNRPVRAIIDIYLEHLFMHEFCHFLCSYDRWAKIAGKNPWIEPINLNEWINDMEDALNHFGSLGTLEDELEAETRASGYLREYSLRDYTKGLIIKFGGPYDKMLRKKHPDYVLRAGALEIFQLQMGALQGFITWEKADECINIIIDQHMDIIDEMEDYKFKLVD